MRHAGFRALTFAIVRVIEEIGNFRHAPAFRKMPQVGEGVRRRTAPAHTHTHTHTHNHQATVRTACDAEWHGSRTTRKATRFATHLEDTSRSLLRRFMAPTLLDATSRTRVTSRPTRKSGYTRASSGSACQRSSSRMINSSTRPDVSTGIKTLPPPRSALLISSCKAARRSFTLEMGNLGLQA